jgi:MarR family 2-MHQ and catechol resistance regulon transcriptional repressor
MGSHYRGTRKQVRALSAFINLMRAADSLAAASARRAARDGLTHSQFGVLEALYHLGPLPQKALGDKLLKTSGNITMVVSNLERAGLVERRRDERDRRFVTVRLTVSGHSVIARSIPRQVAGIVEDLSVLGDDEQELLRRLCRRLGKREKE